MPFRDWPRTLRRASYKGVAFFVEADHVETGRRLVVHQFPLKDAPYIEDLGRDANKISVSAYVVSDNADGEEKALRSVCESGGAGRLVLPMEVFAAHCEKCSRDFAKDKLGFVAFKLEFVREGVGSIALPAGFLGALVGQSVDSLNAALSMRFLAGFSTGGAAGFVRDAAVTEVQMLAATLDVVARGLPLEASRAPAIYAAVTALYDDATTLATTGLVAEKLSRTSFVAALPSTASAALVERLAAMLEDMRLAVEPATFMASLSPLTDYAPAGPIPTPTTPSRRRIAENAVRLAEIVRMAGLVAFAKAAAARIYSDRREAIQARADAAEMFGAELESAGESGRHHAWTELAELNGRLAEYLTRRIADLAPVIGLEAASSMPSLWWANRLYGGADRAGELIARNRVVHASFMPAHFEALAR
jgi:DNA circularisation protein N-terminus